MTPVTCSGFSGTEISVITSVPALNRTSCRSAQESSLGFCLQVSWVAKIRLDFLQICKAILLQSLQQEERKEKKRKSVKSAIWAGSLLDHNLWTPVRVGCEVGLLWAWGRPGVLYLPAGLCVPVACTMLPRLWVGECGCLSNPLKNIVYHSASKVSWHGEKWTERS